MRSNENPEPTRSGGGRTPERTPEAAARTGLADLRALQGLAGNAAVVQMLRRAGHPWAGGPRPDEGTDEHRHGAGCGHGPGQPSVQRSTVHDVLRTPGRPLDDATRADMEARLGADFSDVRVHDDGAARASAAEVGARAYTSGAHVVIGDGGGDAHTLAHELTHVIQQRQGPVAGTDDGSGLRVSDPSDRFEREAEANAVRVMRSPVPAPDRAVPDRTASDRAAPGPAATTGPATAADGAVQRLWNGGFGNRVDDDGDVSMGSQSTVGGAPSQTDSFSSQASQGSSFASLGSFDLNWTPTQTSRPRAEEQARQAQAAALEELRELVVPAECEGAQRSMPEAAAHPGAVDTTGTITVYREAGWVPPRTGTRNGPLQTSHIAQFHSVYFNYKIQLINDAQSPTYVNPQLLFRVVSQTPRSNGRGSQGRTYMFDHRWSLNPAFPWPSAQAARDAAEIYGLDRRDQLEPHATGFVPLPTSDTEPFVFHVEEERADDRFLDDERRFLAPSAFDQNYAMAGLVGSAREQVGISRPPLDDRRTGRRSTAQAMAGTQAHDWVDAAGSMGGRPGVLAKYEWCHLIGDGDSGPNIPENLVIGTNAVNTEQLAMEIGLRRYVRQLSLEGFGIELRTRAIMRDAPEQGDPDALDILGGAPLMADWISYEIGIRSPHGLQPLHRQIMDASRGTITESEFTYLQNAVENQIRHFIETTIGEAESDDEAGVAADVGL
ncbi:DUF4157 domain-containing protein [Streptomyces sp. NPDC057193]|uniref:eCIS core domain-containing protein n=1 Tax=Streptomyces sp. NPDC057193 TaxID=3346043 RepID=UPI00363ACA19